MQDAERKLLTEVVEAMVCGDSPVAFWDSLAFMRDEQRESEVGDELRQAACALLLAAVSPVGDLPDEAFSDFEVINAWTNRLTDATSRWEAAARKAVQR